MMIYSTSTKQWKRHCRKCECQLMADVASVLSDQRSDGRFVPCHLHSQRGAKEAECKRAYCTPPERQEFWLVLSIRHQQWSWRRRQLSYLPKRPNHTCSTDISGSGQDCLTRRISTCPEGQSGPKTCCQYASRSASCFSWSSGILACSATYRLCILC